MNRKLTFFAVLIVTAAFSFGTNAQAKGKKARILPGGVVFPNLNQAAQVNPATLNSQKGQSLQVLYTPPLDASQTAHDGTISYASSSKNFGLGLGYLGTYSDTGTLTSGAFVGGGFNAGDLGFGVALRETDLEDTNNAAVDLGISYVADKSLQFALVGKDLLADSRTVTLGVGYQKLGKYNLELNVTSPGLDNLASSEYLVSLIGGIYVGRFGASFTSTYNVGTDTTSNEVTGLISIVDSLDILLTVDMDTVRTYTFGFTYTF